MKNWAGIHTYRAAGLEEPRTIDELRAVVAGASRVRALGTRHSFNDLADTDAGGILVTATGLPEDPEIDAERGTVAVGAGVRYAGLAGFLSRRGWALHNLGSLPHISVGGATATGTHGSGDGNTNLSGAVTGLQIVGPEGDLRWVRRGDPDFSGSVVALGLLGVVVRIELAIQPTYLVRQDVYLDLPWEVLLEDPSRVTGAGYSVSVFTDWAGGTIGQVWVKRRTDDPGLVVPDDLLGARRDDTASAQILESVEDDGNTTVRGAALPWAETLPHFRIDATPSNGDEIQTEYFVDRRDAVAALTAVRALAGEVTPHLHITELRTMTGDDLWLSPAQGRDSMAIHFTWRNEPDAVARLTPRIEAALEPFAARPHWGKVHTMAPEVIASRYPRFDDFRRLVERVDPDGKFGGPHTDALLAAGAR